MNRAIADVRFKNSRPRSSSPGLFAQQQHHSDTVFARLSLFVSVRTLSLSHGRETPSPCLALWGRASEGTSMRRHCSRTICHLSAFMRILPSILPFSLIIWGMKKQGRKKGETTRARSSIHSPPIIMLIPFFLPSFPSRPYSITHVAILFPSVSISPLIPSVQCSVRPLPQLFLPFFPLPLQVVGMYRTSYLSLI